MVDAVGDLARAPPEDAAVLRSPAVGSGDPHVVEKRPAPAAQQVGDDGARERDQREPGAEYHLRGRRI